MAIDRNCCILCFQLIEFNTDSFAEHKSYDGNYQQILLDCCNRLLGGVDISLNFNCAQIDYSPFCAACFQSSEELWQIERNLDKYVETFTTKILQSRMTELSRKLNATETKANDDDLGEASPENSDLSLNQFNQFFDPNNGLKSQLEIVKKEVVEIDFPEESFPNETREPDTRNERVDDLPSSEFPNFEKSNNSNNWTEIKPNSSSPKLRVVLERLEFDANGRVVQKTGKNIKNQNFDQASSSQLLWRTRCKEDEKLMSLEEENTDSDENGNNNDKSCQVDFENGMCLANQLKILEDLSWFCEICNETFLNAFITRKKHLKIVHSKSEVIRRTKKCGICQKEFKGSLYSYEVHLLEHQDEIPFECKSCKGKFYNIQNYTDHHRYTSCATSGPENTDTFECDLCYKVFKAKYLLLLHRLGHTNPERKPFNCEICQKRFPGSGVGTYLVEKHFIAHTKEIPFPCDICEKRYTTTFALENHRISHNAVKLTCDTCSDTFFTSKQLCRHKIKCGYENKVDEDKSDKIQCSICDKEMTKKHLKHHLAMHEEISFKCDICGNKYRSQKRLDVHYRNCYLAVKCGLGTTTNNDSEDKGKMHCEICGTNFVRQSAYENHLKFHNEENPYECANRKCKSKFRSFADLKVHYNENSKCQSAKEANKVMFKYRCPICSKPMKTPAALIIHERSHTGEKPFKCNLCDASFNRKDRLARHQEKHDKNYLAFPYPCKICPMKFSTHKGIVTHYKTSYECKVKYNESKKHKCDFCDKRFETKLKLIVHCRAHKDEGFDSSIRQPFECQTCGKDFGSKKNLIHHEKSH